MQPHHRGPQFEGRVRPGHTAVVLRAPAEIQVSSGRGSFKHCLYREVQRHSQMVQQRNHETLSTGERQLLVWQGAKRTRGRIIKTVD